MEIINKVKAVGLTLTKTMGYAFLAPAKSGVIVAAMKIYGVSRFHAVFLRLKSQFICYVGLSEAPFEGAGSVYPVLQPCSVRLHVLQTMLSSLLLNIREDM